MTRSFNPTSFRVLIAIPMYNCEKQVTRVFAALLEEAALWKDYSVKVLAIDNRSQDETYTAAHRFGEKFHQQNHEFEVIQNPVNLGLGGSQKVAFYFAQQQKFDLLIVLHGDDQAKVSDIIPLLKKATENSALAAVLGSRFSLKSQRTGYSKTRIFGNVGLNLLYSILTGRWIVDLGSGLNLFRIKGYDWRDLDACSSGFTFNMDLLLLMIRKNWAFKYLPIHWRETDQVSNARNFKVGWQALKTLLSWRLNLKNNQDTHLNEVLPSESPLRSELGLNTLKDLVIQNRYYSKNLIIESALENIKAQPAGFPFLLWASPLRHFNHLIQRGDFLEKTGTDITKLRAEFEFYKNIPPSLQNYFPLCLGSEETSDSFTYTIKYLRMFDLSRFLIQGSLSGPEWLQVFHHLKDYFQKLPTKRVQHTDVKKMQHQLFVEKLLQRLSVYKCAPELADSLAETTGKLLPYLEQKLSNLRSDQLFFTHGDLCFSNILYSKVQNQIKFVDPRGVVTAEEVFQPLEYDLCKLSQCVYGGYDWIMAQNFAPDFKQVQKNQTVVAFEGLLRELKADQSLIALGEASLFLSMLPLHKDQPHLHEAMIQSAKEALLRYERLQSHGH